MMIRTASSLLRSALTSGIAAVICGGASNVWAQATYDPPTAQRPPPNVLLLLDQTRTTSIDAATPSTTCSAGGSRCHVEQSCGGFSGEWDCNLWKNGGTRVQLARRVLTGGYGWNTTVTGPDGKTADAQTRTDGVMDTYKVRWGVAWYDGLGVRLVHSPDLDNVGAQQAVIQLNGAGGVAGTYNDNYGPAGDPGLHSFMEFPRTTSWGNSYTASWSYSNAFAYPWIKDAQWFTAYKHPNPSSPGNYYAQGYSTSAPNWNAAGLEEDGRLTSALVWVARYWQNQAPLFTPPASTSGYSSWFFKPNQNPQDSVVASDVANVLNYSASDPRGCRRNFTIVLSDSHGANPYDVFWEKGCPVPSNQVANPYQTYSGGDSVTGQYPAYMPSSGIPAPDLTQNAPVLPTPYSKGGTKPSYNTCLSAGQAASEVYNLGGLGGTNKANQVFLIHFGIDAPADEVADYGWDGISGGTGITTAFNGAPGGVPSMAAMQGAFNAIFTMILAGTYVGSAPTITRAGDHMAQTQFQIKNCSTVGPTKCNIGRPGSIFWDPINSDGSLGAPQWDAGAILTARPWSDRTLYTVPPTGNSGAPSETTCGAAASNSAPANCTKSVNMVGGTGVTTLQGAFSPVDTWLNTSQPIVAPEVGAHSQFIMGDPTTTFFSGVLRSDWNGLGNNNMPYKISDIANSRPIVVGAPPGIGDQADRWKAFRARALPSPNVGQQVLDRDQVMYVGGNDGFLHAFLTGKPALNGSGQPIVSNGNSVTYVPIGTACRTALPETPVGGDCDGKELWAYAPGMLQQYWPAVRGGHYYMVDGTPVVDDVLFTKGVTSPGNVCGSSPNPTCGATDWEYRTVMVECLGAGGPGCFALDITDPRNPGLLWERQFTGLPGKGSSTSLPVIAKVKRVVGTTVIPYYVALMGGGANEGGGNQGTFIAVGLEDGQVFYSNSKADAPFAGGPSCLDADADGYVDTCYIAATNTSIWKVRLEGGDPNPADTVPNSKNPGNKGMWMAKIFSGPAATGNSTAKTMTRLVASYQADGQVDIFMTSGDIANIQQPNQQNYFFKIKDTNPTDDVITTVTPGTPTKQWSDTAPDGSQYNVYRQKGSCPASLASAGLTQVGSNQGTYALPLGEGVYFDMALVDNAVTFTSYAPDPNPCVLGQGYLYGIAYDTCGNGLTPSNTPGATPTAQKISIGQGLPSQVAVNWATGGLYDAVAMQGGSVSAQQLSSTTAPPYRFRMMKLWWREQL